MSRSTKKVDVVYIDKKCSVCHEPLHLVKKHSGAAWYECGNSKCLACEVMTSKGWHWQ